MNKYYKALSDELHACIETGNPEQAKVVCKLADEYLNEGKINLHHRADIEQDFDIAFPDA